MEKDIPKLVVGDIVIILFFIWIGAMRHHSGINGLIETSPPFLIGWFLVAPITYSDSLDSYKSSLIYMTFCWIIAATIGAILRATPVFRGNSPLTFFIVMMFTGVIFLAGWRSVYILVKGYIGS